MRTKKTEEKKEFNLDEAFVLWLKTSKDKKEYLSGHDLNNNKIVGFFNTNKTNEKQPDVELYQVEKDGKRGDKVVSLWNNLSKDNKDYLLGTTNEEEKIVAFYGDKEEEKRPYIRGYFKEN